MKLNPDAVPATYGAAVAAFRAALTPDDLASLLRHGSARAALACAHHSGGQYIRNAWSLWDQDTPLLRDMKAKGLFHADDISSAIIMEAIADMFGERFDLEAHVRHCREHWLAINVDPDTGEKLP